VRGDLCAIPVREICASCVTGDGVYSDATSLTQLPEEWGYQPAAVVVSTVVSHPKANYLTAMPGTKQFRRTRDSDVRGGGTAGSIAAEAERRTSADRSEGRSAAGDRRSAYLVPRHVCPTVNNFDEALIIEGNRVVGVEKVTGRGTRSSA